MIEWSREELIAQAIQAREQAYAPYSNYKVGAALLTKSGQTYTGCNVENAVYPLTICAERTVVLELVALEPGPVRHRHLPDPLIKLLPTHMPQKTAY